MRILREMPVGGKRAQIRSKGATHLIKWADRAKMDAFRTDYPSLTVLVSASTFKSPILGADADALAYERGGRSRQLTAPPIVRARSHRSDQRRLGGYFTSMPSADGDLARAAPQPLKRGART